MKNEQLLSGQKKLLEKQGYRMVGSHSSVKTCGWTKNMIRGRGGCYKYVFYGIRSHQCMQMTTSMYCASRCTFCWRGLKAPVSKTWYGKTDSPKDIIKGSLKAHQDLLQGFKGKGYENHDKEKVKEMKNVRHVALSLTGEPITYPKINEILNDFHKNKISTFLVTNAQFPEQIEKINHVTQLYLSIDAPTKPLLKKIDRPLFDDYWERMLKALDLLKTRKYRTCIRLSLIKKENMSKFKEYAELIKRGEPDFLELKSYMWVGASQKYYKRDNMPGMKEMKEFSDKLLKHLPEYEYVRQHIPSRAFLLMKKSLKKKSFIDFPKFFELATKNQDYTSGDYCSRKMLPNE